jgi:hypothetical protein
MDDFLLIVLSDELFDNLASYLTSEPLLNHEQTRNLLTDYHHRRINWDTFNTYKCYYHYLLGNEIFPGLLSYYAEHGWVVEIVREEYFNYAYKDLAPHYDLIDVQFASQTTKEVMMDLLYANRMVTGWAPSLLGNRLAQTLLLYFYEDTRKLLPYHLIIPHQESIATIKQQEVEEWFPSDFLIVKSFFSSGSKMPDGGDYRILHKKDWTMFADMAQHCDPWFSDDNGLIVAELIETSDPYVPASKHVLHKAHLASCLPEEILSSFVYHCDKLSARLHLHKTYGHICQLGEVFEEEAWRKASIKNYSRELFGLAEMLSPVPCLFSVDLMIKNDGTLKWLEFNKLAGTYLNVSEKLKRTPLQDYLDAVMNMDYDFDCVLSKMEAYCETLREIEKYRHELLWIDPFVEE